MPAMCSSVASHRMPPVWKVGFAARKRSLGRRPSAWMMPVAPPVYWRCAHSAGLGAAVEPEVNRM